MPIQTQIVLIAHNIRSTHNVGSLFRTAEGLGINALYLTGYTPYPILPKDGRLPHLAQKIDHQINKTALGATEYLQWNSVDDIFRCFDDLHKKDFRIAALEQTQHSIQLPQYKSHGRIAVVVGNEVDGLPLSVLDYCDDIIEIPMLGKKESYNVVQAAAMALYQIRFL